MPNNCKGFINQLQNADTRGVNFIHSSCIGLSREPCRIAIKISHNAIEFGSG